MFAVAAGQADLGMWNDSADIRARLDAEVRDRVARNGGDGDGHILQILLAALRGDDDIADALLNRFGPDRLSRAGPHRDKSCRGDEHRGRDSQFIPFFHLPVSLTLVIAFATFYRHLYYINS